MYRLLTRAEVEQRLASYSARFSGDYFPGCERWIARGGFELALTPEDNGLYHEFMIDEAERLSLAPTLGPRP